MSSEVSVVNAALLSLLFQVWRVTTIHVTIQYCLPIFGFCTFEKKKNTKTRQNKKQNKQKDWSFDVEIFFSRKKSDKVSE